MLLLELMNLDMNLDKLSKLKKLEIEEQLENKELLKLNTSQNNHRTGVSTFASHTSPSQSLQKSFHLSSPDKIELKKISSPSENKKYATAQPNDRQKSVAMQTPKPLTVKRFNYSVDRRPACNRVGGSVTSMTECASHTTVRAVLAYGGSLRDGLSCK